MRPYLIFLFPILRDLRIITKKFQSTKGNNLEIFRELHDFFMTLARRILKPAIFREKTAEQLCELNIDTEFCILSLDNTDYGQLFLREIENLPEQLQTELKTRARD